MLGRYLDKSDKSVEQTQTAISEGWLRKERKRCSGNKDVPHWTTYNDMANIVWITESSLACGANTASASVLLCYYAGASGARGGCSGHKTRLAEAAPLGARETGAGCPWCLSCLLVHAAFALRVTTGCATK